MLISDSIQGLQKQSNCLLIQCTKNLMVANEVKTKYMLFRTKEDTELYFDGKRIERVNDYKYLENIISETKKNIGGDIFANNYSHLCSKASSSTYAMKCKLNKLGHLPPRIATLPILTYVTEVWGVNKKGTEQIDKLCPWCFQSILGVKPSTSNYVVWGELGYVPPSVKCHIKLLHYYDRLRNLPDSVLVKRAYNEALHLHEQGFKTWILMCGRLQTRMNSISRPKHRHSGIV